ncbi:MAG: aminopeptidase P family protein [Oscillospiraceae bacterium]|jgi:Xaa-Pro aminopeptidase|nr:aminopeptidase P family protein [Oscillospiraceae bacterium]
MSKIEELIKRFPEGVDAGLISSVPNRRYFLGFSSSDGHILVTREKAYFLIDSRYIEAARDKISGFDIILEERLSRQLPELIQKHGIKNLALENDYITVAEAGSYREMLPGTEILSGSEFSRLIISMRKIKTPDEISLIRQAQDLTDETFVYILNNIQEGRSEREIALDMEFYMRRRGADAASFEFIVVAGENSSKPHGVPGERKIRRGDFITMDFGAEIDGYRSDMTRTVALGSAAEKQKLVYETVLKAQLAGIAAAKAGVKCSDVDKAARDIINGAGFEGKFGHGLGHAVGVEIHEEPRFSPRCDDIAEEGLVMTVEPGIYLEGEFGARIEDMGLVTQSGFENFTASEKKLIIL